MKTFVVFSLRKRESLDVNLGCLDRSLLGIIPLSQLHYITQFVCLYK